MECLPQLLPVRRVEEIGREIEASMVSADLNCRRSPEFQETDGSTSYLHQILLAGAGAKQDYIGSPGSTSYLHQILLAVPPLLLMFQETDGSTSYLQ